MKTKIKEIGNKVCTYFYGKEMPKNIPFKCLSAIMVDSVIRINSKCYTETLLEERKYKIKNYKIKGPTDYDFDKSSFDESDNEPDSETDSELDNSEPEKPKKSDNETN